MHDVGGGQAPTSDPDPDVNESRFDLISGLDRQLRDAYERVQSKPRRLSPVRLYLMSHIGRQAQRLRNAYDVSMLKVSDDPEFHDWLKRRSDDLEVFVRNLKTPSTRVGRLIRRTKGGWTAISTAAAIVPSVLGLPVSVGTISAIVIAWLHSCFCEVFTWTVPVLLLSILALGNWAFQAYRNLLIRESPNVFELEQRLMKRLGAPAHGEVQWDVIAWFAIAAIDFALPFVANAFNGERPIIFRLNPWIQGGVFTGIGLWAAIGSMSRKWGWRPAI